MAVNQFQIIQEKAEMLFQSFNVASMHKDIVLYDNYLTFLRLILTPLTFFGFQWAFRILFLNHGDSLINLNVFFASFPIALLTWMTLGILEMQHNWFYKMFPYFKDIYKRNTYQTNRLVGMLQSPENQFTVLHLFEALVKEYPKTDKDAQKIYRDSFNSFRNSFKDGKIKDVASGFNSFYSDYKDNSVFNFIPSSTFEENYEIYKREVLKKGIVVKQTDENVFEQEFSFHSNNKK